MRALPPSARDPGGVYNEVGNFVAVPGNAYRDFTGRTRRSTTINPSENTLVMLTAGQSLSTGASSATYNVVNTAKMDNYYPLDGSNWNSINPSLGVMWNGSVPSSADFNRAVADGVISNGKFDRVIQVPLGLPGTSIDYWVTDSLNGFMAGWYRTINAAILKLAAQGITPSTPGVKFLIKWNQGESDTTLGTSQAAYTAYFQKLMALCPCPGAKWMIARETWINGVTSAAVQAAQTALVDNVTVFAGENMDSIGAGGRYDNTHLNQTGHDAAAALGIAAITAISF